MDIQQKLPTKMATEKLTKNALKAKNDSLQMEWKGNQRKSTIDIYISPRQSNNLSTGGDSSVYTIKSYKQVEAHQYVG